MSARTPRAPRRRHRDPGLQPSPTTNGNPQGENGGNDLPHLIQSTFPAAPTPGNNKNTQKLAQEATQTVTPVAQLPAARL